jgi:transcriptional regulator with XRE-family HTH domain
MIANMLSLKSSAEIAFELAERVKTRRLQRGWTQTELAQRAGVKPATYILFERTGRIALVRLLKILDVIGLLDEFDAIGRHEDLSTLTLADVTRAQRKRGRRALQ